jgi:hypothetical protein
MARCLSLTDTFWMKRADETLTWDEVSLYRNPFDDVIARIAFDGTGMYGRQNSPTSPEYATSGTFAKCWVRDADGQVSLLKRGSSGFANTGFEPYSEALAADMLEAAGVAHVPYRVVSYHGKIASACPLFTSEDVGFVAAHRFFKGPFSVADMLEFATAHSAGEAFREMVAMDAVMANTDRHAGNYGFTVDNRTGKVLGLAPLFDHNMACLPLMMGGDDLAEYLATLAPKIGDDFVGVARQLLTPAVRAKLVRLRGFSFKNPGHGYPDWKVAALDELKDRQLAALLA